MNRDDQSNYSRRAATPEQRAQAARRRAARQRQLRRRRIFWLFLLLAILAGVLVWLIQKGLPGQHKTPQSEPASSLSAASEPAQSEPAQSLPASTVPSEPAAEPTAAPAETNDAWQMRLVNAKNPLPEGYEPPLAEIPGAGGRQFDARALDALNRMIKDGNAGGLSLMVCSAYRSVARQDALFESMRQDYIAQGYSENEAYRITATIRAPHGCSEHSSGLAADIVAVSYQTLDSGFADTQEGRWLAAHCAEYGFILRYPADKQDVTGIIYEPWHFRYVGTENAAKIQQSGLCLEEYLAS